MNAFVISTVGQPHSAFLLINLVSGHLPYLSTKKKCLFGRQPELKAFILNLAQLGGHVAFAFLAGNAEPVADAKQVGIEFGAVRGACHLGFFSRKR